MSSEQMVKEYFTNVKRRFANESDCKPILRKEFDTRLKNRRILVDWQTGAVAAGVFGEVFLAWKLKKGIKPKRVSSIPPPAAEVKRDQVLKHIPDTKMGGDPRAVAQWAADTLPELRITSMFSHIHVVLCYEVYGPVVGDAVGNVKVSRDNFAAGAGTDGLYMLLERVHGGTLEDFLGMCGDGNPEEYKLIPEFIGRARHVGPVYRGILAQICSALIHLTRLGVTHNDLHLGNLMFDRRGTVKLIDLGRAKVKQDGASGSKSIELQDLRQLKYLILDLSQVARIVKPLGYESWQDDEDWQRFESFVKMVEKINTDRSGQNVGQLYKEIESADWMKIEPFVEYKREIIQTNYSSDKKCLIM